MDDFQRQLKAVHDGLTRLMAEARLDSLSRSKLADISNQILGISQELDSAVKSGADPSVLGDLVKMAMDLLSRVAKWWNDGS